MQQVTVIEVPRRTGQPASNITPDGEQDIRAGTGVSALTSNAFEPFADCRRHCLG